MKLYEEIIFLENFFDGKFVVENVIPYYEPLIKGKQRGRHIYWTNFNLPTNVGERLEGKGLISTAKNEVEQLSKFHDYDFRKYKGSQSVVKMAQNLVDYEVGKTILQTALGIIDKKNEKQLDIFT